MSRFQKLSHVLWHCQYHLVWTPKYRYRVLSGQLNKEVHNCVNIFSGQLGCEIVDLNIKADHIHLIINVPPKVSISQLMGTMKGRTAIRVFKQYPYFKQKPYWGNHFWAKGYCVDTIGLDPEMIRKYVQYQEEKDRVQDQRSFQF
jgi:putative transposase